MSKLSEVKKDYKDSVENDYKKLLVSLNENLDFSHKNKIIIDLLFCIKTYFDEMKSLSIDEPYFDLEPLINIFSEDKSYLTHEKNYNLGCFIHSLILCGSSAEQAYKASSIFLGHKNKSPETSKKAYTLFKNLKSNMEMDINEFVSLHSYRLKKFIDQQNKPFPSNDKIKKAKQAFDTLLVLIEKDIAVD